MQGLEKLHRGGAVTHPDRLKEAKKKKKSEKQNTSAVCTAAHY